MWGFRKVAGEGEEGGGHSPVLKVDDEKAKRLKQAALNSI
jgi:hypothetical protein